MTPTESPDRRQNAAARSRPRLAAQTLVVVASIALATAVATPGGDSDAKPAPADADERRRDDEFVARFERAQRLLGKGADAEAEELLRQLVAERPEEGAVHHALGVLLQ